VDVDLDAVVVAVVFLDAMGLRSNQAGQHRDNAFEQLSGLLEARLVKHALHLGSGLVGIEALEPQTCLIFGSPGVSGASADTTATTSTSRQRLSWGFLRPAGGFGSPPRERCRPDLNRGMRVLQTLALPLGHGTAKKLQGDTTRSDGLKRSAIL
jgi:hypothetical protein